MGTFMCGVEMDSFPGKTDTTLLLGELLEDLPPALSDYRPALLEAFTALKGSMDWERLLDQGDASPNNVEYRKGKALLAEQRLLGIEQLYWVLWVIDHEHGISQQIHDWHLSMENLLSPDDFKDWAYSEPDDLKWKRTFED